MVKFMPGKAQISSQLFIFILAVLIISLTLIFGVKIINTLRESGGDTAMLQFQKYLERTISSVDSGEEIMISLNLPAGVKQVCFCGGVCQVPTNSGSKEVLQYIKDERRANYNNTVFLVRNDYSIVPLKISNLNSTFLCINQSDKVRFIGRGKVVDVELP